MKKPFWSHRRLLFCSVALVVGDSGGQRGSKELWLRYSVIRRARRCPGDPSAETVIKVEHERFVERDGSRCSVQRFVSTRRGPFRSLIPGRMRFTCKSAGDSNSAWTQHVFADTNREGRSQTNKWNWGENYRIIMEMIQLLFFYLASIHKFDPLTSEASVHTWIWSHLPGDSDAE